MSVCGGERGMGFLGWGRGGSGGKGLRVGVGQRLGNCEPHG